MLTHGPWRVGKNGEVVTDSVVGLGPCDAETLEYYGGNVICETVTPSNAALIAVAPEILEILQSLYDAGVFDMLIDGIPSQIEVEQLIRRAHEFSA